MPVRARWKQFRDFSGPVISRSRDVGSIDTPLGPHEADDDPDVEMSLHLDRAFWLTAMVECDGQPGLVNMYDGCGATCGLHQAIAVYPRDLSKQGPLWKLLWRIDAVFPIDYYYLGELLHEAGWSLSGAGKLVSRTTGVPIRPRVIRDTLTPMGGKVPRKGKRWQDSVEWARAFHEIFAHGHTHRTQILTGIEHITKAARRWRLRPQRGAIYSPIYNQIERVLYTGYIDTPNPFEHSHAVDLAVCMFWSCFVNAPSPSMRALEKAIKTKQPRDMKYANRFAKHLIKLLGNNKYGRWDDDIPGGRYQRARGYAMKVWPEELFEGPGAVMPKDLPG